MHRTAKVWRREDFSLVFTLEGHEQAVWAVLALTGPDDLVLTGSSSFVSLIASLSLAAEKGEYWYWDGQVRPTI